MIRAHWLNDLLLRRICCFLCVLKNSAIFSQDRQENSREEASFEPPHDNRTIIVGGLKSLSVKVSTNLTFVFGTQMAKAEFREKENLKQRSLLEFIVIWIV